eukprot:TRINITY_DN3325_c0_g1_i2.p1 TRINITY_DN3325_c0_g1~~TRINITY_DN3325_c0_g1_i2.p1  ORF type:complete len:219 (+),score=45.18 TRINITY_DN3325_c0_g1_i2:425-1081(+)
MSPLDDTFVSAALDNTVRFWDLKSTQPTALIRKEGAQAVAYGPSGLVIGVATSNMISLFDHRALTKGPFSTFKLNVDKTQHFPQLTFSDNDAYIGLSSNQHVLLIDAYNGNEIRRYKTRKDDFYNRLGFTFTPDSDYLICGTDVGELKIISTDKDKTSSSGGSGSSSSHYKQYQPYSEICSLKGHIGPINCVQFNPVYNMMVSACTNIAMWIPNTSPK